VCTGYTTKLVLGVLCQRVVVDPYGTECTGSFSGSYTGVCYLTDCIVDFESVAIKLTCVDAQAHGDESTLRVVHLNGAKRQSVLYCVFYVVYCVYI
jgi:hypothetical protein